MDMTVGISLAGGAGAFFLLHVGIWRAFPSNEPRMTLLGALLTVGIALAVAFGYVVGSGGALELCTILWVGVACSVFYVLFYSVLARSVSLTLLGHLWESGGQPLVIDDLVKEYAASDRFEDRVRLMQESGLARIEGEMVFLTEQGTRLARWARSLGRIVGSRLEG